MTCYVLLLFALSFSSLLRSVLASFPEWRDTVMWTPAFLVISVCLYNKDGVILWCFVNRAVPMLTWTISVMLWSECGPKPGFIDNPLMDNNPSLIMVMFFTISRAWIRQTGMGHFQCQYCFMFQMRKKKCFNVYAPSYSSINNIYNRNASCHFWCNLPFIPIIFAITKSTQFL